MLRFVELIGVIRKTDVVAIIANNPLESKLIPQDWLANGQIMGNLNYSAYIPSDADTKLSQESSRILTTYLNPSIHQIEIVESDGHRHSATIPAAAYRLLVDALIQMAQGNAVSLVPIHAELTTQEAADLLNVSRPYLIKQIELGAIPHHKVGKHRRINFNDLMIYKDQIDLATVKGLDEMIAISQELGLYD